MVFLINFPVLTPLNRMGWLKENIDIVETGLTMLHKTNLLLSYWSYAFNTAVYLLNRILPFVLNFVSPWQKLYLKKPSLHAL